MTNREYSESLHKKAIESLTKYHKAEHELSLEGGGFIDKKYFDKVSNAYKEWQEAQNDFNSFLSFIVKNGLNLDDEMTFNG